MNKDTENMLIYGAIALAGYLFYRSRALAATIAGASAVNLATNAKQPMVGAPASVMSNNADQSVAQKVAASSYAVSATNPGVYGETTLGDWAY